MKFLWSGTDQLRLALLRSELEANDIRFIVKNEALSIATGYLPSMEICPEVWIVDAERFEEAKTIADYLAKQ